MKSLEAVTFQTLGVRTSVTDLFSDSGMTSKPPE